jgi:hypothetical protein
MSSMASSSPSQRSIGREVVAAQLVQQEAAQLADRLGQAVQPRGRVDADRRPTAAAGPTAPRGCSGPRRTPSRRRRRTRPSGSSAGPRRRRGPGQLGARCPAASRSGGLDLAAMGGADRVGAAADGLTGRPQRHLPGVVACAPGPRGRGRPAPQRRSPDAPVARSCRAVVDPHGRARAVAHGGEAPLGAWGPDPGTGSHAIGAGCAPAGARGPAGRRSPAGRRGRAGRRRPATGEIPRMMAPRPRNALTPAICCSASRLPASALPGGGPDGRSSRRRRAPSAGGPAGG